MFQAIITRQRVKKAQKEACQPLPQAHFLTPGKSPATAVAINAPIVAYFTPKPWLLAVIGLQRAFERISVFYRKERYLIWLS